MRVRSPVLMMLSVGCLVFRSAAARAAESVHEWEAWNEPGGVHDAVHAGHGGAASVGRMPQVKARASPSREDAAGPALLAAPASASAAASRPMLPEVVSFCACFQLANVAVATLFIAAPDGTVTATGIEIRPTECLSRRTGLAHLPKQQRRRRRAARGPRACRVAWRHRPTADRAGGGAPTASGNSRSGASTGARRTARNPARRPFPPHQLTPYHFALFERRTA